ncbi:receptor-type tyrosine-protein phosphatase alpha-like [Ruditapes philippinarum]|uniref:receptor-type tyrosine-protein phosphatase alpha-like n=1 Tax=Ruditapes philippinarum TaxID=129788 RepID=UPI00295C3017|nr:receptor-type tyrosine-protein phosphatase alpha-like [Ruditapes philippinarum]
MVWHMKVEIIVMLTNLNEPSGMKCEQYWPDVNQSEMFGDEHVFCQELYEFAEYTIRKFEVSSNKNRQTACRRIVQLHYTAWPDKKTPEDVVTLLEFRHKFRNIDTTLNGPVIIHCSAGIGRTGVFIAIDKLILEGHSEGTVNVAVCVKKMREMRMKMVQTTEQYKFIFKALAYALYFDSEPIQNENLIEKIEGADDTLFDIKYQELLMCLENTGNDITSTAAVYENVMLKDMHTVELLDNYNRVHLYLNRGYDDTDYINAVYINSFKLKDHLIMAQSPLPGTEFDFLTMIYQENCSCIVSIEDISEQSMAVNKCFPTNNRSTDIGCFTVCCTVHKSTSQYTVSKMTIKNKGKFSDDRRDFYHFQYKNWKAKDVIPENAEEFVEFVKDVGEYITHTNESSHVLVHCLNGSERSGIYCAVAIIMEKIFYDKKVSVLNTLRHLRTRRPNAITSMEQMKFCFKAAKAIAETQIKTSGISKDTPY